MVEETNKSSEKSSIFNIISDLENEVVAEKEKIEEKSSK